MIELDFYQEVENSIDQLLKFQQGHKQHESPTIDEEHPNPDPSPNICVTSACEIPLTGTTLAPASEVELDPVIPLTQARKDQQLKLYSLWSHLSAISQRKSSTSSPQKKERRKRKLISKPQKL